MRIKTKNQMSDLCKALINSDQASDQSEADGIVSEMRERMLNGEDPEEILLEYGLEPDYVFDIMY